MSRKLVFFLVFAAVTCWMVLFYHLHSPSPAPFSSAQIDLPHIPSAAGVREDPLARQKYEHMVVANPYTGELPAGIRERELRFSSKISTVSELRHKKGNRLKEVEFVPRGPFNVGGRTRALAIDRSNEKVLLGGGISGGLWRSADEGQTWTRVTSPDIINSVSCIVQDTRSGKMNTWYFGTGEYSLFNSARANNDTPYRGDGIFKSTDGGLTWQPLPATATQNPSKFGSPFQYVYKLVVNTHNLLQDEIFAAAIGGIYRSTDGGQSWDSVLGADLLAAPSGSDLNNLEFPYFSEIAIGGDGLKFAAIGTTSNRNARSPHAGLFASNDGVNWRSITPAGFPADFRRVVIAPVSGKNEIYVLTDAAVPNLWKATYSVSGSFFWSDLSENIPDFGGMVGEFDTQNGYNMLLEVHPDNPQIVFAGGTNLYRSTDGFSSGNNTSWIGGYDPDNSARQYPGQHADQHVLTFYTGNPASALSATDGGISRTANILSDEVQWTSLNNGYITSQFFTVDIPKFESSNLIIGGMQDNGTYLRSAPGENPLWNQIFTGDGAYCQTTPGGTFWYVSAQMAQIYRLTFNSNYQLTSYARVDPLGGGEPIDHGYLFVNPFRLDPLNSNVMYLAGGNIIWKNTNLSQIPGGSQKKTAINWKALEESRIQAGQITSLEIGLSADRSLVYGNSTGRLYKLEGLDDEQYHLTEITHPLFPRGFISSISIDAVDPEKMLVIFSNYEIPSIFFSADGGDTFTHVGGNLEENADGSGSGPSVRWGQLIPLLNGKTMAIVGTSTGVYSAESLDGEVEWAKLSNDLIGNSVVPMLSYNPSDGRLVAATHGNGVFETYIEGHQPVEKPATAAPFTAGPAFPNPFGSEVKIPVEVPSRQLLRAVVYDASGKPVKTIAWGTHFEGRVELSWDGSNVTGTPVANGMYFCRIELQTGEWRSVALMLVR